MFDMLLLLLLVGVCLLLSLLFGMLRGMCGEGDIHPPQWCVILFAILALPVAVPVAAYYSRTLSEFLLCWPRWFDVKEGR